MSSFYRYYDTPDGHDYFKKQYFLSRRAYPMGLYLAVIDTMAVSRPFGVVPTVARFVQVFSRPVIAVTLFNTTVFMSTRLRGKDDALNHGIGFLPVTYYLTHFFPKNSVYCLTVPALIILMSLKQYKLWYPNLSFFEEPTTYKENADNSVFADFMYYVISKPPYGKKNWVTLEQAVKDGIVESKDDAKEKKMTNYKDGQVRGLVRFADGSEFNPLL